MADSSVAETIARQARSNSATSSRTCCSSSGEILISASSIRAPSASRKNRATIMISMPKPILATSTSVSPPNDSTGPAVASDRALRSCSICSSLGLAHSVSHAR